MCDFVSMLIGFFFGLFKDFLGGAALGSILVLFFSLKKGVNCNSEAIEYTRVTCPAYILMTLKLLFLKS